MPRCASSLESPLDKAGDEFDCPVCGQRLRVPGAKERAEAAERARVSEELRLSEARARAARDAKAKEEAQRAAMQSAAAQRAAEENERRQREQSPPRAEGAQRARSAVPATGVAAILLVGLLYLAVIWPLQARLSRAETRLREAEAAVDGLKKDALRRELELLEVGGLARNANRHAHSHGF